MSSEDPDCVLFTDEEERAKTALGTYLEERNGKSEDASGSYRYFVMGEETLTIIEDIKKGDEYIYNRVLWEDDEMEIERNIEYERVEELLNPH